MTFQLSATIIKSLNTVHASYDFHLLVIIIKYKQLKKKFELKNLKIKLKIVEGDSENFFKTQNAIPKFW